MRAIAREGMVETLEVLRKGTEQDPMGGTAPGEPVVVDTSVCSFSTRASSASLVGDAQRNSADGLVKVPGDETLDVRPEDQVRIAGQVYEVQGHLTRSGTYTITKQMLVARV
jgi:hypothetical protein